MNRDLLKYSIKENTFWKIYLNEYLTKIANKKILENFYYSIEFDLKNINFKNRIVLDVGCGNGLTSVYFALEKGDNRGISLDNYQGQGNPSENKTFFSNIISKYGLDSKITLVNKDICDHSVEDIYNIDIVYFRSVLHHIYESKIDLRKNEIPKHVKKLAENIKKLCASGGFIIINDIMPISFYQLLPINIITGNIYWETKQYPEAWIYLFEKYQFINRGINYYVPFKLRIGKKILSNRYFSYFLKSRYRIVLEKR